MPLYEYRCADCTQRFEKLIRSTISPDSPECPHCGSTIVSRLPSTFAPRIAASAAFASSGGCAPSGGG
jgi:putative FmdB family regulatory protein